jgi:segregation and condensation protein A
VLTDDYRVHLDAFEGPLDLLLFLIRKNEVDVHDIPIAAMADQYMAFLSGLERVDIDAAGEFLVMAATLTEIKARMLTPTPPDAPGAGGTADAGERASSDPRADLVKQLLEYKQYRDAADALEHRFDDWKARFPANAVTAKAKFSEGAALGEGESGAEGGEGDAVGEAIGRYADATGAESAADLAADLDMEDLDLVDLVEAFRKIVETVDFRRVGDHQVTYDDTPIELHAEDLLDRLRREAGATGEGEPRRGLTLQSVFHGRTRNEMIGLFLAMLELVRRRAINIKQDVIKAEIQVILAEPEVKSEPAA